ncbi:MAG TPA: hypothetical protein VGJ49_08235 [Gaiellaceae bacterium]|jgi:hypothetical protein
MRYMSTRGFGQIAAAVIVLLVLVIVAFVVWVYLWDVPVGS